MKLFRETKGDIAYSIIEFDGTLPDDAEDQISLNPYVQDVILYQFKGEYNHGF